MRNKQVKKVTTIALFIAVEIILSRFLGISTPIMKISLSFIPLSLTAMLYGPLYSAFAAAASDFIGALLFPVGMYFPGYTLTAFLTGLTYGVFLYKRKTKWACIIAAAIAVNLCWRLGLNSFWVYMTTGKAVTAIMLPRIMKNMLMIPIETVVIKLLREKLLPFAERMTK